MQILERHKSLSLFSQQGFEAAHKWHKQIWERATSRGGGNIRSIEQVMLHIYRTAVLELYVKANVEFC